MLQQNKKIILIVLLFITVSANTEITVKPSNIDQFENNLKEQQKEYRENKKEEKEKLIIVEPFCRNLAQNVTWWQMTAEELQKIKNNGLGYSELVKVILIAKKIDKSPDEIVKRRQRGESFQKISERYKIDYTSIKEEAKKIRKEVHPVR